MTARVYFMKTINCCEDVSNVFARQTLNTEQ